MVQVVHAHKKKKKDWICTSRVNNEGTFFYPFEWWRKKWQHSLRREPRSSCPLLSDGPKSNGICLILAPSHLYFLQVCTQIQKKNLLCTTVNTHEFNWHALLLVPFTLEYQIKNQFTIVFYLGLKSLHQKQIMAKRTSCKRSPLYIHTSINTHRYIP